MAWAYSIPGFTDFNIVQYTIFNRSGHVLDSLLVGGMVDMDCGPITASSYWQDDEDLAGFPSCVLPHARARHGQAAPGLDHAGAAASRTRSRTTRRCALTTTSASTASRSWTTTGTWAARPASRPSCWWTTPSIRWGSRGRPGWASWRSAPTRAIRRTCGGGAPRIDQQRFEFMSGAAGTNIGEDGLINQERGLGEGRLPGVVVVRTLARRARWRPHPGHRRLHRGAGGQEAGAGVRRRLRGSPGRAGTRAGRARCSPSTRRSTTPTPSRWPTRGSTRSARTGPG